MFKVCCNYLALSILQILCNRCFSRTCHESIFVLKCSYPCIHMWTWWWFWACDQLIMVINLMQFMTSIFCSYIWSTRSREF